MRCVVIGAGYAGTGQALAMQHCGVEVVCICARNSTHLSAKAQELKIKNWSTDWRQAVTDHRPDIVCLATSASLREEVVELCASLGIHVYCDKPLATTALAAEKLTKIAQNIKTAYAATRRYDPTVLHLASLIQSGDFGEVRKAEYRLSACLAAPIPFFWALRLDQGGGILNNHFPHVLSILERVFDGKTSRAAGRANFEIREAPEITSIHDYRQVNQLIDELESGGHKSAPMKSCDADTSYRATLTIETRQGEIEVDVTSSPTVPPDEQGLTIFGSKGTLFARGSNSFEIDGHPTPKEFDLPIVDGSLADRYAALARDFIKDIEGQPFEPYLTFDDGCRFQQLIEAIRGF